jgi:hypothetical protein
MKIISALFGYLLWKTHPFHNLEKADLSRKNSGDWATHDEANGLKNLDIQSTLVYRVGSINCPLSLISFSHNSLTSLFEPHTRTSCSGISSQILIKRVLNCNKVMCLVLLILDWDLETRLIKNPGRFWLSIIDQNQGQLAFLRNGITYHDVENIDTAQEQVFLVEHVSSNRINPVVLFVVGHLHQKTVSRRKICHHQRTKQGAVSIFKRLRLSEFFCMGFCFKSFSLVSNWAFWSFYTVTGRSFVRHSLSPPYLFGFYGAFSASFFLSLHLTYPFILF